MQDHNTCSNSVYSLNYICVTDDPGIYVYTLQTTQVFKYYIYLLQMAQVVTTQVTSSSSGGTVVNTGNRDWKADLFGCFDDCKTSELETYVF